LVELHTKKGSSETGAYQLPSHPVSSTARKLTAWIEYRGVPGMPGGVVGGSVGGVVGGGGGSVGGGGGGSWPGGGRALAGAMIPPTRMAAAMERATPIVTRCDRRRRRDLGADVGVSRSGSMTASSSWR
jgi:hypothetical protein